MVMSLRFVRRPTNSYGISHSLIKQNTVMRFDILPTAPNIIQRVNALQKHRVQQKLPMCRHVLAQKL